jgi:hypothetical protein
MNVGLRSRLARIEAQTRQAKRSIFKVGRLKRLPDDYVGPRHVVDVDRNAIRAPNEETYEFEERPGPAPRGSRDDVMRLFVSEEDMML